MSGQRITLEDLRDARAAGVQFCIPGARDAARRYGINWREFVHEGMTLEDAEATGDAVLVEVAARVRAKEA